MDQKNSQNHIKMSNFQSLISKYKKGNVLVFMSFCLCLVAWPGTKVLLEGKESQARHKAEILSYQLAQLYQENRPSLVQKDSELAISQRGPASVTDSGAIDFRTEGLLGKDPWGQAYKYKVLGSDVDSVRLQIKSSGPDQKFEIAENAEEKSYQSPGDDVVWVFQVPINKN